MNTIQSFLKDASSPDFNFVEYLNHSQIELTRSEPIKNLVFEVETIGKTQRIALEIIKGIASVLFLPYGLYRLLHLIGGYFFVVPAQRKKDHHLYRNRFVEALNGKAVFKRKVQIFRGITEVNNAGFNLVAKRVSVLVNGELIDAMVFGKKENLNNKRWTLLSNGNAMDFENVLARASGDFIDKINELGTNFLLYNYQGVGVSEGWATRDGMVNAQLAMLRFLEDQQNGIGAKEIISLGVSIGGGVAGHAELTHQRKPNIRYVDVRAETFGKMSDVPSSSFLRFLMRFTGWEFNTKKASKLLERLKVPEIITQRAKELRFRKHSDVLHDGRISEKASHAYKLLRKNAKWVHKTFIGIESQHCVGYNEEETKSVNEAIKFALSPEYKGFHPHSVEQ